MVVPPPPLGSLFLSCSSLGFAPCLGTLLPCGLQKSIFTNNKVQYITSVWPFFVPFRFPFIPSKNKLMGSLFSKCFRHFLVSLAHFSVFAIFSQVFDFYFFFSCDLVEPSFRSSCKVVNLKKNQSRFV